MLKGSTAWLYNGLFQFRRHGIISIEISCLRKRQAFFKRFLINTNEDITYDIRLDNAD